MTKTAMIKERNEIWDEYRANCRVCEKRYVEIVKGSGKEITDFTGQYEWKKVWVRDMAMEEWNADKTKRYNYLNAEIDKWKREKEERKRQKEEENKIERYKIELENIMKRAEYLKKFIEENDK